MVSNVQRELTIAEAVDLTGLTRAAIERRIERGSLPSTKRGRLRYVQLEDLYELGMVRLDGAGTVRDLLDRLEHQAERIGRLTQALNAAGVAVPDA